MPKKHLDTSTKIGRIVFAMKDISTRMKPEVRARVIRVFNTLDHDAADPALRFRLRDDLEKMAREPQLSGLVKQLYKELPQT